jgi:OOP family OmpA-OmpF porin
MKLNRIVAVAMLSLGLVFSAVATAQVPITITLGGTQNLWDDERDVDNELLPSAAIEYRFGQNWAGELTYSAGEADAVDGSQDVDIDSWQAGMLYYFTPQESLHPYLGFGAGELVRGFNNGDASDTQVNAGAGFRYYITDHWNWRADARWLHTFDDSINDVAVSLGIAYSFAPPPSRAKSSAAPVVAAVAVIDSDGDGVADDMDACPNTPAGARVDARGCKLAVTKVASVKLKVNFAFDSDDVQEHYFADLQGLADFLKRFEDMHVDIEGHTDSAGDTGYNQNLSQRRADAVRELLINEYGVAAYRLEAKGYGESRPVAGNDTKEGRAENRRVMATLEVEYDE